MAKTTTTTARNSLTAVWDLIDRALEFLSCLDWTHVPRIIAETVWRLGPLGLLPGATAGFFVARHHRWGVLRLQGLFQQAGIPAWGWTICGDEIVFDVKWRDAERAYQAMVRAGVPLLR